MGYGPFYAIPGSPYAGSALTGDGFSTIGAFGGGGFSSVGDGGGGGDSGGGGGGGD